MLENIIITTRDCGREGPDPMSGTAGALAGLLSGLGQTVDEMSGGPDFEPFL
ncbi:MAG: hypothetical protein WD156_10490 [Acidimicrobiia bacterium]